MAHTFSRNHVHLISDGCNTYNHVINGGFQYDAAGNMTHDASHSYTYDAENRVTQVDGGGTASCYYDAEGRRIDKVLAGVDTDYVYDLSGNDPNGRFQRTLRDWIFIHCIWLSDGDACMLEQKGRFHLNVINPDDVYFSTDAAQMEYTLGLTGRWSNSGANAAMAVTAPAITISTGIVAGPTAATSMETTQDFAASHPGEVVDFMRGFFGGNSSIPPPSDAGMAGWGARQIVNGIMNSSH